MNDRHAPHTKTEPTREILTGVPDGLGPLVLAQLIAEAQSAGGAAPLLLHVARDDRRLEALAEGLKFFAPQVRVIAFPAWDTVPYDRIGPNAQIVATRIAALARLVAGAGNNPTVVLTTVNAILQRVPPRTAYSPGSITVPVRWKPARFSRCTSRFMSMRWPAAMVLSDLRMNSRGGTRCRIALTVVSTTVGLLRAPATSLASVAIRVATICAFGPMRS